MFKAIYYNSILKETYTLCGVLDLAQAWDLLEFAANRKGWHVIDVHVKITSL